MKTSKSFYTWIKDFKNEASPIGDLANDILSDTDFPRKVSSYGKCLKYFNLYHPQAERAALDTLKTAWGIFAREKATFIMAQRIKKKYLDKAKKLSVLVEVGT